MSKRVEIAIYDLSGKRLCQLYDSLYAQDGAAQDLQIVKERNGWKEMSMTVPRYMQNGEDNYRLDFLKNENLMYLYEDGVCDTYAIKIDSDIHNAGKIELKVNANHTSEELKTKNLYKYFTDENGIANCETLIERALGGTGWKLVYCDRFFESDGVTEKIRSYNCDTKTGAYTMISEICKLFQARPVFHGFEKTVEIHATADTTGFSEVNFGKNMDAITRKKDTSNIVTRLYVEGEYGEFGYVGIENYNNGLPFILNFDYYKELGVFTSEHQGWVDWYTHSYAQNTRAITAYSIERLQKIGELRRLIGTCGYVCAPIVDGVVQTDKAIYGGNYEEADKEFKNDDNVIVIHKTGGYDDEYNRYYTYPVGKLILDDGTHMVKFIPAINGEMGGYEEEIDASKDTIRRCISDLYSFFSKNGYIISVSVDSLKQAYGVTDLSVVDDDGFDVSGLQEPYSLTTVRSYAGTIGDAEKRKTEARRRLNEDAAIMISKMEQIAHLENNIDAQQKKQAEEEDVFAEVMGGILRDGYWSDDNYTVGQEESLYRDALDISKRLAFPIVTYSMTYRAVHPVPGYEDEAVNLAQILRIYDKDVGINDMVYVDKTIEYPDNPMKDNIELTTDLLGLASKSFTTMIERMTELADAVKNNRDVYKRAVAISKDGKIRSSTLEGAIDTLTTKLMSTTSNWETDERGNIVFTALDGQSAMMLCGAGFMIANSKKEDGSWNWRTFGTGDGFAADMIVTGFLDAERIEARSITAEHLSSDVGKGLDLSSNVYIRQQATDIDGLKSAMQELTPEKIVSTVTDSEKYRTDIEQLSDRITAQATDIEGLEGSMVELTPDKIVATVTSSSKYKGDLSGLSDQISSQGGDIDGIKEAMLELTPEKIVTTVRDSNAYQTDITQLSDRITAQASDISGVKTAVQEITPEHIVSTVTTSEKYKGDLKELSDGLTSQSGEISTIKTSMQELTPEKIVSTVTESNKYKSDLSKLEGNIDETAADVTVIKTSMQELTSDRIISTVTESTKYKSDLQKLQDDVDETSADMYVVKTSMQELTPEKIVSTVTQSTKYTGDMQKLEGDISQAESDISGLQDRMDEAGADIIEMQSEIEQTASSISMKVSKGDVSSQLSLESGKVELKSNRLVIDSDNFKLDGNGTVSASGSFTTKEGDNSATLSSAGLTIKNGDDVLGVLRANATSTDRPYQYEDAIPHKTVTLEVNRDAFTIATDRTYYFVYNNGLNTWGFTEKIWVQDLAVQDHLRFGNGVNLHGLNNNDLQVDGGLYATGNLWCGGTKYRIVPTEHYGTVGMNSMESTVALFSDVGSAAIGEDGLARVDIAPDYIETIDLSREYQVFTTQTSEGAIGWVEKNAGHFIVHGEPGTTFDWMMYARQKGYADHRMERVDVEKIKQEHK